jgi:hypothetical protein
MIPSHHSTLFETLLHLPSLKMIGNVINDQAFMKLKTASYTGLSGMLQAGNIILGNE